MPELTPDELSALFAWIVDAQAFLPLSEAAKPTVDKLVAYQETLKQKEEVPITLPPPRPDDYRDYYGNAMWSDENIAEFGELL